MGLQSGDAPKKGEEIVVFWLRRDAECAECGEELGHGRMIRMEEGRPLCLGCADLDHLVFLPRGDMALTRRASRHSRLRAVVVQWSRTRKRYERQGILVEEDALAQAEEECLSDADKREERRRVQALSREQQDRQYVEAFARAIQERYPGCPRGAEIEIAEHACEKYSGRVGRSAAAKELDPVAIERAVAAHARHRHTSYDAYLMAGWDRGEARAAVAAEVEGLLDGWQRAGGSARHQDEDR
jgi:hypothetical protein